MGGRVEGLAGPVYLGQIAARYIEFEDQREMRLLLDTNVFLEILLEQEKAEEALEFLKNSAEHEFYISDFTIHSIGIILFYKHRYEIFYAFLSDIESLGLSTVSLKPHEMASAINPASQFNLDFDDAYQYALSQRFDLEIVSFDSDFDNTPRGRKKPGSISAP